MPGGLRIRHPPATNHLFDGAPDLRFVEVLASGGAVPTFRVHLQKNCSANASGPVVDLRSVIDGRIQRIRCRRASASRPTYQPKPGHATVAVANDLSEAQHMRNTSKAGP